LENVHQPDGLFIAHQKVLLRHASDAAPIFTEINATIPRLILGERDSFVALAVVKYVWAWTAHTLSYPKLTDG
jgi:hypothetical protein